MPAFTPTPDQPYRDDVAFVNRGGEVVADGKLYWPTLLRIRLTRADALRMAEELLRAVNAGGETVTLSLSGKMEGAG